MILPNLEDFPSSSSNEIQWHTKRYFHPIYIRFHTHSFFHYQSCSCFHFGPCQTTKVTPRFLSRSQIIFHLRAAPAAKLLWPAEKAPRGQSQIRALISTSITQLVRTTGKEWCYRTYLNQYLYRKASYLHIWVETKKAHVHFFSAKGVRTKFIMIIFSALARLSSSTADTRISTLSFMLSNQTPYIFRYDHLRKTSRPQKRWRARTSTNEYFGDIIKAQLTLEEIKRRTRPFTSSLCKFTHCTNFSS